MPQFMYDVDDIIFRICGIFAFRTPAIVVRDPEAIKQITIKDFAYFEDKRLIGNDSDKLIVSSMSSNITRTTPSSRIE